MVVIPFCSIVFSTCSCIDYVQLGAADEYCYFMVVLLLGRKVIPFEEKLPYWQNNLPMLSSLSNSIMSTWLSTKDLVMLSVKNLSVNLNASFVYFIGIVRLSCM